MNNNTGDALPIGWAWTTIGQVTQPIEKVDPTSEPDAEFVYLDISSIDNSRNVVAEPKFYRGSEAPSRARQVVRANDTLFSTVRTYLRNIALVPEIYDGQIASTGFSVLRAESGIEPKYLFYLCLENGFLQGLEALQRGTSYPAIRDLDMRQQVIPLPPLPEQHRIVEAIEAEFTRLDAGVAALKRLRANFKRYKATVLKAAAEGKLVRQDPNDEPAADLLKRILRERRLKWESAQRVKGRDPQKQKYEEPKAPDTEGLPELPEGWVWAAVGQLLSEAMINGKSVQSSDDGFPVLRLTALKNGSIDFEEFKLGKWDHEDALNYLVRQGDFLVARGNGSLKLVGRGGLISVEPAPMAFPDTMIRLRFYEDSINPNYVSLVWNSPILREQIEATAHTTAGIYKINQQHLASYVLPLPPTNEQASIVTAGEHILSLVHELEHIVKVNLKRAERLRQAILRDAFAGRLVAQDPNDEPASDLLKRIQKARNQRTANQTS